MLGALGVQVTQANQDASDCRPTTGKGTRMRCWNRGFGRTGLWVTQPNPGFGWRQPWVCD